MGKIEQSMFERIFAPLIVMRKCAENTKQKYFEFLINTLRRIVEALLQNNSS